MQRILVIDPEASPVTHWVLELRKRIAVAGWLIFGFGLLAGIAGHLTGSLILGVGVAILLWPWLAIRGYKRSARFVLLENPELCEVYGVACWRIAPLKGESYHYAARRLFQLVRQAHYVAVRLEDARRAVEYDEKHPIKDDPDSPFETSKQTYERYRTEFAAALQAIRDHPPLQD